MDQVHPSLSYLVPRQSCLNFVTIQQISPLAYSRFMSICYMLAVRECCKSYMSKVLPTFLPVGSLLTCMLLLSAIGGRNLEKRSQQQDKLFLGYMSVRMLIVSSLSLNAIHLL